MSQSPSISQQVLDNNPETTSPHSFYLNENRHLYCSTISLDLSRIEQANLVGSKINQFCEQQKRLAEKDLRIQELLRELQSDKFETNFIIKQLEENVSQLLNANRFFENEILELLKEKDHSNTLLLSKDKIIEELMAKTLKGAFKIEKVIEEKFLHGSLTEHEKIERSIKNEEVLLIDGNDVESASKENILCYFESESESLEEGITRGRLRALEEKEKLLSCFAECFSKQMDLNEEETNIFLNEPLEYIISTFLESLKEHQEKRKELKELNERQSLSILDLEEVIEHQIFERKQIINEKNELQKDFDSLQGQFRPNEELREMTDKFTKLLEEKKTVELQLFRMKMDIEESKNVRTLELRTVVESIGEEERLNNESPSTIEERAESEEESNQNSLVEGFNRKIDQLEEIIESKDARLKVFESRERKYTLSLGTILELSKDFDREFCSFVDCSQIKQTEIFERISRNLENRLRFGSAGVPEVMIPNKDTLDDSEENELHM